MRRLITAFLLLLFACGPAFADLRAAVNALGQAKLDGMEQAIKAVAAEPGDATQKVLDEDPPYEAIESYGTELMAGLNKIGVAHGLDLHVQGLPAGFHVSFGPTGRVHDFAGLSQLDLARYARFATRLAEHGLWVTGRGIWYVSAAHGSAELADTLERFDNAVSASLP